MIFERSAAVKRRASSLGSLHRLMDAHLLEVLSYLSLSLFQATATSKYLYSLTLSSDALYRDAAAAAFPSLQVAAPDQQLRLRCAPAVTS